MFNSRSMLGNPLTSDLLILFLHLWVPIILDKEAWKDIETDLRVIYFLVFGLVYAWYNFDNNTF